MQLTVLITKTLEELQSSYELITTDLTNLHATLAEALSALHHSYLEAYAHSRGKSVAEKNRDADYETQELYQEIILTRGKINSASEQRDLLLNLISWKMKMISLIKPTLNGTYSPDKDKNIMGRV